MNFDKPPVEPSNTGVKGYEPLETTNIANTPTEKLTEILAGWKKFAETKGDSTGVKEKIARIEEELRNRQNK